MTNKQGSKRKMRLMTGLSVLTALGGLSMGLAPAAYADTNQQATNLAEFTNLDQMFYGLNQTIRAEGNIDVVDQFAKELDGAHQGTWGTVLYGNAYTGTTEQNNGVTFFSTFLQLFVNNVETPINPNNTTGLQALEAQVKADAQIGRASLTGTDLYNFYESFRTSVLMQVVAGPSSISGANSLDTVVDNALTYAVQQNSEFVGILGQYGLSIQDIPTIRENIMKTFSGSQAALNDVIEGFIQPEVAATMAVGTSQYMTLNAQNVGTTLNGLALPASWIQVTASNSDVTVNEVNGLITITANAPGPVTLTPVVRGYTLAPISLTVVPAASESSPGVPSSAGSGSTSTGTTTPPSTNSNGTTNYQSTVTSAAFSLVLATQTVSDTGATVSVTSNNSTIAVSVPAGALPAGDSVSVNSAPVSTVQAGAPGGQTALAAFGVSFSGATPTAPIQLQIKNSAIPTTALVYKVMADGSWMPIPATVKNGVLTISLTSDPDFVVVNPNLAPGMRQILWNGEQAQVAYGIVAKDPVHGNLTTYMPIWYAMQVLKQEGITSTWNGKVWNLSTTGSTYTPNLSSISAGMGTDQIEINGTLVQNAYGLVKVDPKHGNLTTYMPIYWVFQALDHLGLQSSWNGTTWDLTQAPATTASSATSSSTSGAN